jgi:hypothetical protein
MTPHAPKPNVDTNINVKKSNAPVCDPSKRLLVCTTSNIKIPGQGDTHRVKIKSKASSQTTDAVANCL